MKRLVIWIAFAVAVLTSNLSNAALYNLIDVGTFPDGDYSRVVKGLNDAGQVVGFGNVNNTEFDDRAFLFSGGPLQNLGQLAPINSFMVASGINNRGQVVGYGDTGPNASTHAWLWTSDVGLTDLGTLSGAATSSASGINSAGFVVGESNDLVFIWDSAHEMREVTPVGVGSAHDISDMGIVVGQTNDTAFRWVPAEPLANASATDNGVVDDLGTLPGDSTSVARGVNSAGDVVGQSGTGSATKAFYWTEAAGMIDIGLLPGGDRASAFDLDDMGNIVGWSRVNSKRRAFIWNKTEGMMDLSDLIAPGEGAGWELNEAYAINNTGQIIGIGTLDGAVRAFLLTPATPNGLIGDFDRNGELDLKDIDSLLVAVREKSTNRQFDLDGSGAADFSDVENWISTQRNSWLGDANLDGEFNSSDLILVFTTNEYEDHVALNSTWATGDWDADGEFTTGDLITAFRSGGYEQGARSVQAVPEPSSLVITLIIAAGLVWLRMSSGIVGRS